MSEWIIKYRCISGYCGEEIVFAVNKFMAWEMFMDISKNYDSDVIDAECYKMGE